MTTETCGICGMPYGECESTSPMGATPEEREGCWRRGLDCQRARAEKAERELDEARRKLERVGALGDMAVLRAEDAERQLASSKEEECEANVAVVAMALERDTVLARIAELEAALRFIRDAQDDDECGASVTVGFLREQARAALWPKPTKEQP